MAPVDLRTFRDGKSYVVDIVKDEASTPARNKARGKPMPMANMEAMPQSSVTAESMAMAPLPRRRRLEKSPLSRRGRPLRRPLPRNSKCRS